MDMSIKALAILLVPFISLFFEGVRRKMTARIHNRIGPPIWQPFYDFMKLLDKGRTETRGRLNLFFKACPTLYFLSTLALFLFIPYPFLSFEFDFVFLIYATILCSAFYTLCGISSNSPYTTLGSMREMILMMVYEITLAIVVFTAVIASGTNTLSGVNEFLVFSLPLSFLALIFVSFVETKITPFDTAEAPTEILGGVKTEYSGVNLAIYETARFMKFTFFIFLMPSLFVTRHPVFLGLMVLFFLFFLTFMQATTSRYRVDQSFRYFLIFLLVALANYVVVA